MKHAVFLDVDDTLLITQFSPEGTRSRVLNQAVLDQLKLASTTDLYLFTNMDLNDVNHHGDPSRVTRKQLVDSLQAQGFIVHGVITPADPDYNQGPGAAYSHFYEQAFAKKLNGESWAEQKSQFDLHASNMQIICQYDSKQRAAAQKHTMFNYFLQHKPTELEQILYCDDDPDCLDFVAQAAKSKNIQLSTCQIIPLPSSASKQEKQGSMLQTANAIDAFAPNGLVISQIITLASSAYVEKNKQLSFFMRLWHSNDGVIRANNFSRNLAKMANRQEMDVEVIEFLSNKNNGNTHPLSYRTHLLAALTNKPLTFDSLQNVSKNYQHLLNAYCEKVKDNYLQGGIALEINLPKEETFSLCGFDR